MTDTGEYRCGTCRWFDDSSGTDAGPCRRHPPPAITPVLMVLDEPPTDRKNKRIHTMPVRAYVGDRYLCEVTSEIDAEFRHPWVAADDWCGEWTAATDDSA